MVWSMPRWETTVIMIEWLSAFLLAVEAIKLENFEAIRVGLLNVLTRLLGTADYKEVFSEWFASTLVLGAIVMAVLYAIIWLLIGSPAGWSELLGFSSGGWRMWTARAFAAFGVLMILAIGVSTLYLVVLTAITAIVKAVALLQQQTKTGVVGILGFLLFSISSIMKLDGVH